MEAIDAGFHAEARARLLACWNLITRREAIGVMDRHFLVMRRCDVAKLLVQID